MKAKLLLPISVTLAVLVVILQIMPLSVCCQNTLKFERRNNPGKTKELSIKGIQYFSIKTIDSSYSVSEIKQINDSVILGKWFQHDVIIPIDKIITVKQEKNSLEGLGYIVAGLTIVGLVVGVPTTWINNGFDSVGQQIIGTLAVGAVSLPLIFIGKSASQVKMSKWKLSIPAN